MRLHNRMTKTGYYTDGELLRWPRSLREFYRGLWHIADDSGCLENDPFEMKLLLYPSPRDNDIAEEDCKNFVSKLLECGKLIPYFINGKQYLYVKNFRQHQRIDKPSPPDTPLPPWLEWSEYSSNNRMGKYIHSDNVLTEFLQSSDATVPREWNGSKPKSLPDSISGGVEELSLTSPEEDSRKKKDDQRLLIKASFGEWYETEYGHQVGRAKAEPLYAYWCAKVGREDISKATRCYLDECAQLTRSLKDPATFLSKKDEWVLEYLGKAKSGGGHSTSALANDVPPIEF